MRQGEVGSPAKWTGAALSGVATPAPLILPTLATRFAASADRLERLAVDQPMAEWLLFMARLARAQHTAGAALTNVAPPDRAAIEEAVSSRRPPLTTDGSVLDSSWRVALGGIIGYLETTALPAPARGAMVDLLRMDTGELDALALAFLRDALEPHQLGQMLYVVAALQIHFTALASALSAESLRLLPDRGWCPACGSTPVSGLVTASGRTPGCLYLYCSLCSTAWNHVRAMCITCGQSSDLSLESIEGDSGAVKAQACGSCGTYSKLLYEAKDTQIDPYADDLASLALDMLLAEAGSARHAPNPLLLTAGSPAPQPNAPV